MKIAKGNHYQTSSFNHRDRQKKINNRWVSNKNKVKQSLTKKTKPK